MTEPVAGSIEVKVQRTIPAPPGEVFDAWLDSKIPGTIWNAADKFVLDAKMDGLFFWRMKGKDTPHYGRFTVVQRPARLEHTWVSPNTLGQESIVTVTFEQQSDGTRMTLVHSNLPDTEAGRRHEEGWTFFLGIFAKTIEAGA